MTLTLLAALAFLAVSFLALALAAHVALAHRDASRVAER